MVRKIHGYIQGGMPERISGSDARAIHEKVVSTLDKNGEDVSRIRLDNRHRTNLMGHVILMIMMDIINF